MQVKKDSIALKLEELQNLEEDWWEREELGDEEEHNAWLEEGVELFNAYIKLDHHEPRYRITLADLYLQWGRDEKIRLGNKRQAEKILHHAIRYSSKNADPYYHLSFLIAGSGKRDEQWTSALFYAKEALEYKLDEQKKVKLFCHMALGYMHLGLKEKAQELIIKADRLDKENKNDLNWFVQLYTDKLKTIQNGKVLHKTPEQEREVVSRKSFEKFRERAFEGKCVVLDLSRADKFFYGKYDTPRLEAREADVLGYLMERSNQPCSKEEIEKAVWIGGEIGETAVKRYVSSIRKKLNWALKREDIKESVLVWENGCYIWKLDMEQHVLR